MYCNSKIIDLDGVKIDITERKQLEKTILKGEQIINKNSDQLKQRMQELSTVNLIAQTVSNATNLQSALEIVAQEIAPLFKAFSTGISLFNDDQTKRTIVVMYQPAYQGKVKLVGRTVLIPRDEIFETLVVQGQAVIIQKAQTNPLTQTDREFIKARKIQELLLVPLKAHGQVIGSISIATDDYHRHFTTREVQLAETIANHLAGTITLFQTLEQERRQRQITERLLEVANTLNRNLDLHMVLAKIFEQLAQVVEHNGGGIFLSNKNELLLIYGSGPAAAAHVGERISLSSQNPTARAFNNRNMLMINDGDSEPHWMQWPEGEQIRSWIGVPLLVDHQMIGILTIDNFKANAYTQDDARIMQMFANQAAIAIHNARLFEALQQSEDRYRIISETLSNIAYMFSVDDKGTFSYVWATEEAARQLTGFTFAELQIQGGWLSIIREEDLPQALQHQDVLRNGRSSSVEYRLVTKEGKERWVQEISRPILDESKERVRFIYGGIKEISERRQLEQHLLQTQKIEAIGQLTSGVAHHFNNMFTAMIGYIALSIDQLPAGHAVIDDLERVQGITQRAAGLTRQLLTFSQKTAGHQTRQVNLNELIINTKNLLEQLIDTSIRLETDLASDLWRVKLDTNQFEQVLINLVINARDAMPQGGTLLIQTANERLPINETKKSFDLPHGYYVKLIIRDNGIGMSDETKAHIFEPFFTTREVGQGTGLGLYLSLGIIKQHKGHIEVESELGQGTTVTIFLLCQETDILAQAKNGRNLDLPKGTETILLVEDNKIVRSLTAKILRQQGYTIIEADSGETALEIFDTQPNLIIDLLLADVSLPQMRGDALASELQQRYPQLQVLLISGYSESAIDTSHPVKIKPHFLAKPFTPNTLVRTVRTILSNQGYNYLSRN